MFEKRQCLVAIVLLTLLAGIFWGGSRYPALNDKAEMGGGTGMSGIGFDVLIEPAVDSPVWMRVLTTDVNWMYTNWKGMTFGLLFAAAVMCLFATMPAWSCPNPFAGSLYGALLGAPLGVCVNCATPIGRGLHEAGTRPVVSLAATISSPTLNFIAVAMTYSLLPWYMATLKVGLTLIFLLLCLPLLAGRLKNPLTETTPGPAEPTAPTVCANPALSGRLSWPAALVWLVRSFLRNLWFIVRKTMPAMLLAGLLGSALVTLVPMDTIGALQVDDSPATEFISLAAFAVFGLFLPVPMTFDVILTAVLLGTGLKPGYAMVLLFTLGIFSVYPFWVISRSFSFRLATGMAATLLVLGVASGFAAHHWSDHAEARNFELFVRELASGSKDAPEWPLRGAKTGPSAPLQQIQQSAPALTNQTIFTTNSIVITGRPFRRTSSAGNTSRSFSRLAGPELGLDEPVAVSAHKLISPFADFRPIASGDIHNDGWEDLIVGSDPARGGFSIYANLNGERFVRQQIAFPALDQAFVVNVMLADIDNDGWLDLFVSTYRQGLYVLRNDRGDFRTENLRRIDLPADTVMVATLGFGDLDLDGDLDAAFGRWSFGVHASDANVYNGMDAPRSSSNLLGWNRAGEFSLTPLPGQAGESLTTLITDLDLDGWPDLFIGNDFDDPDLFYQGGPDQELRLVRHSEGHFSRSTGATMSVIAEDVDNDLAWDLYLAQIADGNRQRSMAETKTWTSTNAEPTTHRHLELANLLEATVRKRDPRPLSAFEDPSERRVLFAAHILRRIRNRLLGEHDPLVEPWMSLLRQHAPADLAFIATHPEAPRHHATPEEIGEFLPQTPNNALLVPGTSGYHDIAPEAGVAHADWAWNAKFADIDHDEDLDLYVVNGVLFDHAARESNRLFRNESGRRFSDQTDAFNLRDHHTTCAFTWLDYDHDGDLDIISLPTDAPIQVFRNETNDEASIGFEVRDEAGNRFGIGTRIVIRYGLNGERHQMREIRSSGGYLSQDAPSVHFGLGTHRSVRELEVHWSTGETTRLPVTLPGGAHYRITRAP